MLTFLTYFQSTSPYSSLDKLKHTQPPIFIVNWIGCEYILSVSA